MAFGLAVYASSCGLPPSDAKLASSRWSDATGRAFTPGQSHDPPPSELFTRALPWTTEQAKDSPRNAALTEETHAPGHPGIPAPVLCRPSGLPPRALPAAHPLGHHRPHHLCRHLRRRLLGRCRAVRPRQAALAANLLGVGQRRPLT